MLFNELNLHPELKRGLSDAGYVTCMPVQEKVLESAFGGQDLYVQSQTGTGKTAAFLVVIFQRLLTEPMLKGKKAMIMVPTRELAVQVEEEAKVLGKHLSFKIGSFYGGVGYTQQTALLRNNVDIMVGTPGRVLDLNQSGQMNLMEIAFLVIDEADRMFDMGFYPDLRKLIRAVPPADRRQTMLFSATLNAWVKNLAWEYTHNPFEIAIEPEAVTVDEVEQLLYHVASADKMKLLLGVLQRENPESAIIFCNTKRYAEIISKRLGMNGYDCEFIMGDLPQVKRLKIIEDIKAGRLRFLVATDVAARGLDIEGLALVVNYDVPNESENYVHRIGRTARAGKTGKAVTLASEQDVYELPGIERYIGGKIPSENAREDLFAEDKSEGKHIHTSYHDDDGGRKPGSRRDSKDNRHDGVSHHGRQPEKTHKKEKTHHGKPAPSMPAKPAVPKQTAPKQVLPKQPQGKHTHSKPAAAGSKGGVQSAFNPNLSELSLEARMAYYKQKYDTSPGDRSKDKQSGKQNKKHKNTAKSDAKGGIARGGAHVAAAPNAAPSSSPQESSPPKKGFFSKLIGIFKKDKKENESK